MYVHQIETVSEREERGLNGIAVISCDVSVIAHIFAEGAPSSPFPFLQLSVGIVDIVAISFLSAPMTNLNSE